MEKNNDRDFKGVWIKKDVWLDKRLNALEKVILVEIDSLDCEEKGCFASNQYLAEFCQCSPTKVSQAISKLCTLGYVYINNFDGRKRELKSRLTENAEQTYRNCKADLQKMQGRFTENVSNNIDNNKVNNIVNKEKISKKEIDTEFESLWQRYPNKKGKELAYKAYCKARANGTVYDDVINGLENYLKEIEIKKTDKQYIKHGSTWFNQGCWQDDYVTVAPKTENERFMEELMRFAESE